MRDETLMSLMRCLDNVPCSYKLCIHYGDKELVAVEWGVNSSQQLFWIVLEDKKND